MVRAMTDKTETFHTRITPELKARVEADREIKGQSLTVWTDRALQIALQVSETARKRREEAAERAA